jgi:streptogramin lyase
VAGADGNLWFTVDFRKNFVLGRMTPSGAVTQLPIQSDDWGQVGNGLNGNLIAIVQRANWRNEVYHVTPAGALRNYNIPTSVSDAFSEYLGAAEGSLWFTDGLGSPEIGLITAGGVIKSYNLSHVVQRGDGDLESMALGQDGNLYLLDYDIRGAQRSATLYRLTPSELAPVR